MCRLVEVSTLNSVLRMFDFGNASEKPLISRGGDLSGRASENGPGPSVEGRSDLVGVAEVGQCEAGRRMGACPEERAILYRRSALRLPIPGENGYVMRRPDPVGPDAFGGRALLLRVLDPSGAGFPASSRLREVGCPRRSGKTLQGIRTAAPTRSPSRRSLKASFARSRE